MLPSFWVVHRTKSRKAFSAVAASVTEGTDTWVWETCLRRLLVTTNSQTLMTVVEPDDVVRRDEEAYAFLLEVACGLHSPIVGETEVFGQFKRFCQAASEKGAPRTVLDLLASIDRQARQVRAAHLSGLGSQTWGSQLRRRLRGVKAVHFIGAGALVQEVVPYLRAKNIRITLHCRNPEKWQNSESHQGEGVESLSAEGPLEPVEALVIAAPLSANEIDDWVDRRQVTSRLTLDLRGETEKGVPGLLECIDLSEFLGEMAEQKAKIEETAQEVREHIAQLSGDFWRGSEKVRPFGWDDLCA